MSQPIRNKFITNLCKALTGNTLVLFQLVEKHGKVLYDMMKDFDRKVFFVYGGTDTETRENIRAITEKERSAIIVASYGTFSTGINIRNLHNIVFSSPSKSRIRVLQSIGRGLRTSSTKNSTVPADSYLSFLANFIAALPIAIRIFSSTLGDGDSSIIF